MEDYSLESSDLDKISESEKTALLYLRDLGLNWEQLKGKKVLDLGSGSGEFALEARKRGVDVISEDLIRGGMGVNKVVSNDIPYVNSDMTQLPFKSETFDLIVARAAFHALDTKEQMKKTIEDAKRTLKKNGEFRFGPGPHVGAHIFDQDELFNPEEEKEWFTDKPGNTEKRVKRIAERSAEFITSIDPDITIQKVKEKDEEGVDSYYLLVKK